MKIGIGLDLQALLFSLQIKAYTANTRSLPLHFLRFLSVIVERWLSSILLPLVVIPSLNYILPSLVIILDVK